MGYFSYFALCSCKCPPSLHKLMQINCEKDLEIINITEQMKMYSKNHYLDRSTGKQAEETYYSPHKKLLPFASSSQSLTSAYLRD